MVYKTQSNERSKKSQRRLCVGRFLGAGDGMPLDLGDFCHKFEEVQIKLLLILVVDIPCDN